MVDFRSGYTAPGVYVSADTSPVSSAVGISPTVVCLVGPGLGYQTFSEPIIFPNNTSSVVLYQQGIQQNSIVVSNGSTTYSLTSDYTKSATDASQPDSVTTLSIVGAGTIPAGTQLTVTYNYANANYFGLNQFGDFASLIAIYGSPFDPTTGDIQSPISLAAQIAFENGANRVFTVTLNGLGSLSDQYNSAYLLTATNFDIDLIVPVFDSGTIADDSAFTPYVSGLTQHLQSTDAAGYPRVAIVGLPDTFSAAVTPDVIASMFNYRRVTVVWPNQFNYFNSTLNTTVQIGGSYAAAGAAGLLVNQPINTGLTRRQLRAISSIPTAALQTESDTNKDFWSSKGVAVLQLNRSGQIVFRHGTTTDTSTVITRELSIVRCQDALFGIVQQSLDQAALIGTPITADTTLAVKGIIVGALETALASNVIQGYDNVAVRQQSLPSGDPTVIECLFSYRPTYPLNYITVRFTLDLSTGDITTSTDAAGATG